MDLDASIFESEVVSAEYWLYSNYMTTSAKATDTRRSITEDRTVRVSADRAHIVVFHADDEGLEIVNGKKGKNIFGHVKHDITFRGSAESFKNLEGKILGLTYTK